MRTLTRLALPSPQQAYAWAALQPLEPGPGSSPHQAGRWCRPSGSGTDPVACRDKHNYPAAKSTNILDQFMHNTNLESGEKIHIQTNAFENILEKKNQLNHLSSSFSTSSIGIIFCMTLLYFELLMVLILLIYLLSSNSHISWCQHSFPTGIMYTYWQIHAHRYTCQAVTNQLLSLTW